MNRLPQSTSALLAGMLLLEGAGGFGAQDKPSSTPPPANVAAARRRMTVEELAELARPSVVVITVTGRDGKEEGVGSGFVVSPDGLIATSLHVIGEARPISVAFANGQRFEAREIRAWDRKFDLAVIRIDADGLPALALGDSDALKQGAEVVTMGNPQGLDHSIVEGVVSAVRDMETEMIQLAIPLEPGNSGGPLLDRHGRVHGILTMKSAVTANLGFAMPINALKPLLARPNPVPIKRWLTIGTLDPKQWTTRFGARWTRKAGRILVSGPGKGFGGRSLCLNQKTVPSAPYEVEVTVQLEDESGAAGLVFAVDGVDRHYGFYPTGGQLRLTRFDGPTVYSWTILEQLKSEHYRPGDWNTLKVRVEPKRILCYVNDHLVIESTDSELTGGQVGLAKFRDTKATFKNFQLGKSIPPSRPPADLARTITEEIQAVPPASRPDEKAMRQLATHPAAVRTVLADRARQLEQEAGRLRKLARAIHHKAVEAELLKLFQGPDDQVDLVHAALLVARLDNDEVDVEAYQRTVQDMAREIVAELPAKADDREKLAALKKYLFEENGFHGSRTDYSNRANAYLNEVLDDREGIPITLSILFLDLSRRLEIRDVVGLSLPGRFVVQFIPKTGPTELIDVFDGGQAISLVEAAELVRLNTGGSLRDEHLLPVGRRKVIVELLRHLTGIALRSPATDEPLHYLDVLLGLAPDEPMEHWSRAMLRYKMGDSEGAKQDFKWLLEHQPRGVDLDRVMELYRSL